jgi:predicted  nucleic acid-binding Zn-ribbon protein
LFVGENKMTRGTAKDSLSDLDYPVAPYVNPRLADLEKEVENIKDLSEGLKELIAQENDDVSLNRSDAVRRIFELRGDINFLRKKIDSLNRKYEKLYEEKWKFQNENTELQEKLNLAVKLITRCSEVIGYSELQLKIREFLS